MNWQLLKEYGVQVFIAADQLVNALIPPLDGKVLSEIPSLERLL